MTYVSLKQRARSTKTILTAGSLVAVFVLLALDKDVRALEVIVPAILLFYNSANVYQDVQNKKTEMLSEKKKET